MRLTAVYDRRRVGSLVLGRTAILRAVFEYKFPVETVLLCALCDVFPVVVVRHESDWDGKLELHLIIRCGWRLNVSSGG